MNEEWRPITGYEGIYSVSSSGRVLSCHSNKILKLGIGSSGRYQTVHLSLNGKKEDLYVHRLAAQEFIPDTDNHPYVDHIDGNTTNNEVSNLGWVNAFENSQCNIDTPANPCLPVMQYSLDMIPVRKHLSISDAAESVNGDASDISRCCRGIGNKTVEGFIWRFVNE